MVNLLIELFLWIIGSQNIVTPNCQGCHTVTFPVSDTSVCTCGTADVSICTVCVCERERERERMKMGAIGGYNEPMIPSFPLTGKVSQRTSARPLYSLCLFPLHSRSLPTFPLFLSFALCPSPYPPSVVVYHSASRSYFGAHTMPRTNTPV